MFVDNKTNISDFFYNGIPQEASLDESILAMYIVNYNPHIIHSEDEINYYINSLESFHIEYELRDMGINHEIYIKMIHLEYFFPEEMEIYGEIFEYRLLSIMRLHLPLDIGFISLMEIINGRIPRNIIMAIILRVYIEVHEIQFVRMPHECEYYLQKLRESPEEEIFCNLISNNLMDHLLTYPYLRYILRKGDWPRFANLMTFCPETSLYTDTLEDINLELKNMDESKWRALGILVQNFPLYITPFFEKIHDLYQSIEHKEYYMKDIVNDLRIYWENT
jgi:hypothetical protein